MPRPLRAPTFAQILAYGGETKRSRKNGSRCRRNVAAAANATASFNANKTPLLRALGQECVSRSTCASQPRCTERASGVRLSSNCLPCTPSFVLFQIGFREARASSPTDRTLYSFFVCWSESFLHSSFQGPRNSGEQTTERLSFERCASFSGHHTQHTRPSIKWGLKFLKNV